MHPRPWIATTLWFAFCAYLGIGGWMRANIEREIKSLADSKREAGDEIVHEGMSFASLADLRLALESRRGSRWFPFGFNLPTFPSLAVTAIAFGSIGGLMALLLGRTQTLRAPWNAPLLGSIAGFAILLVAYVVPAAITLRSDVDPHPTSVFLIAFLGGCFPERVSIVLERLAKQFLASGDKQ